MYSTVLFLMCEETLDNAGVRRLLFLVLVLILIFQRNEIYQQTLVSRFRNRKCQAKVRNT